MRNYMYSKSFFLSSPKVSSLSTFPLLQYMQIFPPYDIIFLHLPIVLLFICPYYSLCLSLELFLFVFGILFILPMVFFICSWYSFYLLIVFFFILPMIFFFYLAIVFFLSIKCILVICLWYSYCLSMVFKKKKNQSMAFFLYVHCILIISP